MISLFVEKRSHHGSFVNDEIMVQDDAVVLVTASRCVGVDEGKLEGNVVLGGGGHDAGEDGVDVEAAGLAVD